MEKMPKPKKLPLTKSEYPDEEWHFIHSEPGELIKSRGWDEEFLFYEMARQLELEGAIREDLQIFLARVSEGYFPNYPFLLIPANMQETMITRLNEEGSLFDMHYRILATPRPIEWSAESPFHEEFERQIENAAWDAAAEKAQSFEGLDPEDFMPGSCPGDRAAASAKRSIVAEDDQPFDDSQYHIKMLIDLDYPRGRLIEEFEKILSQLTFYRDKKTFSKDQRGKSRGRETQLSDFAAFRLREKYGKMPAARDKAELDPKKDVLQPRKTVVETDNAWRTKINRGRDIMKEFRERWGTRVGEVDIALSEADQS